MATGLKLFEKSPKDKEKKGMREGSKRENALDRKQMKAAKPGKMGKKY